MTDFTGVKIALITPNQQLVVIRRDDKPSIKYPNLWDLPGGGKENKETPFECIKREVTEELAIDIRQENVIFSKSYPALAKPHHLTYFMAANISDKDLASIILGDEGQEWKLMGVDEYIKHPEGIKPLQARLRDFWEIFSTK